MRQNASFTLAGLILILVLVPFGVERPGLPMAPRGDEATYLQMADSLAHDGDLEIGQDDLLRLFEVFPKAYPALAVRSGSNGLTFDAPTLYAVVAAPFVAWLGSTGPLVMNALLLATMLICGNRYLRRQDDDATALLATCVFVLASPLMAYMFWLHPVVAICAAVFVGLFLVAPRAGDSTRCWWRCGFAAFFIAAAASGDQPQLLFLLIPVLVVAWRGHPAGEAHNARTRIGAIAATLAGAFVVLTIAALYDPQHAPIAPPSDSDRDLVYRAVVNNPLILPEGPTEPTSMASPPPGIGTTFRYFVVGRHVGFLPYFPLAIFALVLFARDGRRDPFRVSLAWASIAAFIGAAMGHTGGTAPGSEEAVASLLRAPGNTTLAPVYAALFFLVDRWRPARLLVVATATATICLGALLFTPFGAPVAATTEQAHVRALPLSIWPLETEWLAHLPDYQAFTTVVGTVWHRVDETYVHGETLSTLGGIATHMWLETDQPLDNLNVSVRNLAPTNDAWLKLGDSEATFAFADTPKVGKVERARFTPSLGSAHTLPDGGYRYPLTIETRVGARPSWRRASKRIQYVGLEISILGRDTYLRQDVFGVIWDGCGAPTEVDAGTTFKALVRPRNTSSLPWPNAGPARVRLGYRWFDSQKTALEGSTRTDFEEPLLAEANLTSWLTVRAPESPGTYTLEADLVFETVAWFSQREQPTCLMTVNVVPAPSVEEDE